MTAPDDLARTLAELTREPYRLADLICNTRHPETRETMTGFIVGAVFVASCADCKHLASVVSRRDADLRTRIEAALNERVTPTLGFAEWAADPLPSCPNYAHVNPEWLLELIAEAVAVRKALDADTREVEVATREQIIAVVDAWLFDGSTTRHDLITRIEGLFPARSRRPADTDTGRGQ